MASPRLGKIIAGLIRGRQPERGTNPSWIMRRKRRKSARKRGRFPEQVQQPKPSGISHERVRVAFVSKANYYLKEYKKILGEPADLIFKTEIHYFPKGKPANLGLEIKSIKLNSFDTEGKISVGQKIQIGRAEVKLSGAKTESETVPIFVHYDPGEQTSEKQDWGKFKVSFGNHAHIMRFSEFVVSLRLAIHSIKRQTRHY